MTFLNDLISAAIGYLLGCIVTAYIIGKVRFHIDIRDLGSGNAGGSNVVTVLGWKYGIITAFVDILKGVVAVYVVKLMFPLQPEYAYLSGMMSVVGHIFPFYLRFRGGKGVATLAGALLVLDFLTGAAFVVVVIIGALLANHIAVGSIAAYILLPVITYHLHLPAICKLITIALAIVGVVKHISNIKRIAAGQEPRFRDAFIKHD